MRVQFFSTIPEMGEGRTICWQQGLMYSSQRVARLNIRMLNSQNILKGFMEFVKFLAVLVE
jgi:hypothetical protein